MKASGTLIVGRLCGYHLLRGRVHVFQIRRECVPDSCVEEQVDVAKMGQTYLILDFVEPGQVGSIRTGVSSDSCIDLDRLQGFIKADDGDSPHKLEECLRLKRNKIICQEAFHLASGLVHRIINGGPANQETAMAALPPHHMNLSTARLPA